MLFEATQEKRLKKKRKEKKKNKKKVKKDKKENKKAKRKREKVQGPRLPTSSAMFREDVSDLAAVSVSKLRVYVPVLTMSLGYVLTVLVEARSGLKFPGPPTFASGLYLNCLGVAFAFMTLSIWLCWHAAMRAQIAMVQLRTRKVRLPVPSQRQLDSARKILSTYEEQGVYDMFRLPFLMPNTGNTPPASDDEKKKDSKSGYAKAGLPGIGAKMKEKVKELAEETGGSTKEVAHAARMPGLTSGVPSWVQKEVEARDDLPKASPSAFGNEAPPEPYEHFELIRQAQKDYWCAEAYARVTFLIGKMHLIQSFAYWLPIHNVAECPRPGHDVPGAVPVPQLKESWSDWPRSGVDIQLDTWSGPVSFSCDEGDVIRHFSAPILHRFLILGARCDCFWTAALA
eukprot:g30026.t1